VVTGGDLPTLAAACGKRAAMRGQGFNQSGHANEQAGNLRATDDVGHLHSPIWPKRLASTNTTGSVDMVFHLPV